MQYSSWLSLRPCTWFAYLPHPSSRLLIGCILCGLVLAGCADGMDETGDPLLFDPCEPLVVRAHGELSAQESASLDAAIALWNAAGPFQLTREAPAPVPSIPVIFKTSASFVHGFYSPEDGSVTINRKLTLRGSTITVAHELGHAFGLRHVGRGTRSSVMNPANLTTEPTAQDAARLRELWPSCTPRPVTSVRRNTPAMTDEIHPPAGSSIHALEH